MSLQLIGNQELYQWETDRRLIVETDKNVSEIAFSHFDKTGNCSPLTFIGYVKQDDVGQKYVTIPNELLKWSAPIIAQYDDVSQIFKVIPKEKDEKEREKNNNSFSPYSDTFGYGNTTGLKGYYIGAVDFSAHKIYLSTRQVTDDPPGTAPLQNESFITAYEPGDKFSIIVPDDHHVLCGEIESIENNVITYTEAGIGFTRFLSEQELKKRWESGGVFWYDDNFAKNLEIDDYTFAVPSKPFEGYVEISNSSFAEGLYNIAAGTASHAEGVETIAAGNFSHAEGYGGQAAYAAHAEGLDTIASGKGAHAEGRKTLAKGIYSHAEGYGEKVGLTTEAIGKGSHAEGYVTTSSGEASHAEGYYTEAEGSYSHAEGQGVKFADGTIDRVVAKGSGAHAEGYRTKSNGNFSHAEGQQTTTTGKGSHAEGYLTEAIKDYSHAEGSDTHAEGLASHSEGFKTKALGTYSHAEGVQSEANGLGAHAEGRGTADNFVQAIGEGAHAEGISTKANAAGAHAEGYQTLTDGKYSHVEGKGTIAVDNQGQHVEGRYNVQDKAKKYLHILGNGSSATVRSNAHTIDNDGNAWFAGHVYSGGKSQDDPAAIDLNEEINNTKKTLQQTLSNALIGKASGEAISIKDISPVEHDMGVTVSSKNLFNAENPDNELSKLSYEDGVYKQTEPDTRNTIIFTVQLLNGSKVILSKILAAPAINTTHSIQLVVDSTVSHTSIRFGLSGWTVNNWVTCPMTLKNGIYTVSWFLINNTQGEVSWSNVQIEKATVATDYTPYASLEGAKLSVSGKNLCPTPTVENGDRIYITPALCPHLVNNTASSFTMSADVIVNKDDEPIYHFFDLTIRYTDESYSTPPNGRLYLASGEEAAKKLRDGIVRHYSVTVNVDPTKVIKQLTMAPLSAASLKDENGNPIETKRDCKAMNIQLEMGSIATEYEPYIEPVEYDVYDDGYVEGVKSIYPNTTLTTNTANTIINVEYNRDINKAFAELQNAIISLGGNV